MKNDSEKKVAKVANEIIGHKGTMKLINDTELTDNGSHYVGDYLGWSMWVFVEGYHAMNVKNRTKYFVLSKDEESYPASWTIKLKEHFVKSDIKDYCEWYYKE